VSPPDLDSPHATLPAEWSHHRACWLAWPYDKTLWTGQLLHAQAAWLDLAEAIGHDETLEILVPHRGAEIRCRAALSGRGLTARLHLHDYRHSSVRDTGPLFLTAPNKVHAASFPFNGWGARSMPGGDLEVSQCIAAWSGHATRRHHVVLEGGAIDVDGTGTCLTTRQCLLNANRNPHHDQGEMETVLRDAIGVQHVVWLRDGLLNDATDGHVDALARFIAPGRVLTMRASGREDPQHDVLSAAFTDLTQNAAVTAPPLDVLTVPSPGAVLSPHGKLLPASYLNFYVANRTVCVPVFNAPADDEALDTISQLFPSRRVIPIPARDLLAGGCSPHSMTLQEPLPCVEP
jgi:agmatine deiminase